MMATWENNKTSMHVSSNSWENNLFSLLRMNTRILRIYLTRINQGGWSVCMILVICEAYLQIPPEIIPFSLKICEIIQVTLELQGNFLHLTYIK
jgi:hypothetical protein